MSDCRHGTDASTFDCNECVLEAERDALRAQLAERDAEVARLTEEEFVGADEPALRRHCGQLLAAYHRLTLEVADREGLRAQLAEAQAQVAVMREALDYIGDVGPGARAVADRALSPDAAKGKVAVDAERLAALERAREAYGLLTRELVILDALDRRG